MNFDVDIRTGEATAFVRAVFSDQLPFATSLALNRVGLAFQGVERDRLDEIFTIRRKPFAKGSIRIRREDFANKRDRDPQVTVRVESAGGRSDIFAKFETEDTKEPLRGRSIAVPTANVRRTAGGIIPKRFRPKTLLEGAVKQGNIIRGQQQTWLVRRPGGRGTLFQRLEGRVFALYQFVPRVKLPPDLEFVSTATRVVRERWPGEFTRAFDQAILSAGPGRVGPRSRTFSFGGVRL